MARPISGLNFNCLNEMALKGTNSTDFVVSFFKEKSILKWTMLIKYIPEIGRKYET